MDRHAPAGTRDGMTTLIQPHPVNDPFGDPALYLDFRFAHRALQSESGRGDSPVRT